MNVGAFTTLVADTGFPIACVVAMAIFIAYMIKKTTDMNDKNMEKVQNRCLEREEKLFEEIKANREINGQAIATIALYADKLDMIQTDISEIKTDITILTAKADTTK